MNCKPGYFLLITERIWKTLKSPNSYFLNRNYQNIQFKRYLINGVFISYIKSYGLNLMYDKTLHA